MKQHPLRYLALVSMLSTPLAQAELIKIPVGQQKSSAEDLQLPAHGTSSEAVKSRYGEPLNYGEAVGEPPISRWQYDGFAVYFEYDHVVHAVQVGSAKVLR